MLLILSRKDDVHVRYMLPFLRRRRIEHRWIDSGDFPGRASISLSFDGAKRPSRRLNYNDAALDLENVTAVWYRYPLNPAAESGVTQEDARQAVTTVSRSVLAGLSDTLDARWLPARPRAVIAAQNKARQLTLAPQLGFTIPRTLITNDPAELLAFWELCEGRMVTKLLSRVGAIDRAGGVFGMHTHVVRRRDLANYRALRYAPMILQEYVPKRVELRVTVVGERVFPCQIDSQASRATRHDWRHHDHDRAALSVHALPDDVAASCVRMLAELGLCYGALDLVLTPEGEYVFLELNPMGEWAWVQVETGLPIADAILDELTAARQLHMAASHGTAR